MIRHVELEQAVVSRFIHNGTITLGGNRPAKIYGKLSCTSGKKMKAQNRVFFQNEAEAIAAGYRPCGHCMRKEYLKWKNALF